MNSNKNKIAIQRYDKDYVEMNGGTQDKLNFSKINTGYAGIVPEGTKRAKVRKAVLDQDQTVDVFHNV